jgi:selenocysteine lyase/cysteine desulfurase
MTSLNFLLSRAFARTLRPGDEIVHTALDHDANVSPWLEIAHDLGVTVLVAGLTEDLEVDYADLESKLSDRTRVVAFPAAAKRRTLAGSSSWRTPSARSHGWMPSTTAHTGRST